MIKNLTQKLFLSKNNKFNLILYFLLFTFLFSLPVRVYSASELTLESVSSEAEVAPQGSSVAVYSFIVKAHDEQMIIKEIKVKNLIGAPGNTDYANFGTAITRVAIYKDLDNGGAWTDTDTLVSPETTLSPSDSDYQITMGPFSEAISTTNTEGQRFFIVYELDDDNAQVGTSANVQLTSIRYEYGDPASSAYVDMASKNSSYNIPVSGFKTYEAYDDVKPSITIPGEGEVPIMRIKLRVENENIYSEASKPIKVKIYNAAKNYVTTSNSTNGIIKARLLYDYNNPEVENFYLSNIDSYTELDSISSEDGEFADNANLTFEITGSHELFEYSPSTTVNLFVTYELGDNFQVESGSQVKARLEWVSGYGSRSDLEITKAGNKPDSGPSALDVAGLVYTDLEPIEIQDNVFGSKTSIPILKFNLKACNTEMSLKSIVINNAYESYNGSIIPFVETQNGEKGIKEVSIYLGDNNDYLDINDTLLGTLQLSNIAYSSTSLPIAGNKKDIAVVTFNYNPGSGVIDNLIVPKYTDDNNLRQILVLYRLGNQATEGADGTSGTFNIGTYQAVAKLENALAFAETADDRTITVNLSGIFPASASPEAAVPIIESKISLISAKDISPDSVMAF